MTEHTSEDLLNVNKTRYIPVTNWEKHHEWPRIWGLRNIIFNRHTNGLDKFGVVKKICKRVLIDEAAFFAWVESEGGYNHENN